MTPYWIHGDFAQGQRVVKTYRLGRWARGGRMITGNFASRPSYFLSFGSFATTEW